MSIGSVRVMCTLGPASLDPVVIRELDERGVDLFRINLSHTALAAIEPTIEFIRLYSQVPISLDTEGPQVRCGPVVPDLVLERGAEIDLLGTEVMGTVERLTLRPADAFAVLTPGTSVTIDFHGVSLRVLDRHDANARALVEHGGRVGSNKAVTIDPAPELPPLSRKDVAAIEVGRRIGIRNFALSFAASRQDVNLVRGLIPSGSHLISKIESRAGVCNLDEIIEASNAVLIDRGDLSKDIPLDEIPYCQKMIVRRANRWRKPVYVATNLLESMVRDTRPTVAEANDIANTLLDGAHGLVLAAETAIGIDPVGAVDMVTRCIAAFERAHFGAPLEGMADPRPAAISASVA